MKLQQTFAVHPDRCILLGKGKLQAFVKKHIEPAIGFTNIVYLEHPRFIMQYRRSKVDEYIAKYVDVIRGLK